MADSDEKRPVGRPSLYTPELAEEIALAMLESNTGLYGICMARDDFPHPSNVWNWQHKHPEFREMILRAKELQAERFAYEARDIFADADRFAEDKNTAGVTHAKNKSDYLLKLIPKIAPREFGDRQAIDVGSQDGKPITFRWASEPETNDAGD